VVRDVLVRFLASPAGRPADVVFDVVHVQRGHADLANSKWSERKYEPFSGSVSAISSRPCALTCSARMSSRVDWPLPTTITSPVRPPWSTPSMLMLATVWSSGYSGCVAYHLLPSSPRSSAVTDRNRT